MSNKMWESTVEHARECVLDDKLYSYCSGHGIVLLFNCVYEVVGVIVGTNCFALNALDPTQKALVAKLQQDAYKFPDRIAEFKVQSQSQQGAPAAEQTPAAAAQAPAVPAAQVLGLIPQGVVHLLPGGGAPGSHDGGLLLNHPLLLQQQPQPLSEALEDVLQSAGAAAHHHQLGAAEPWSSFPSFGVGVGAGGFDARDPFDVQFSGSQTCGLLLSSTGARL
jgi:hypothetical protein